MLEIKLNNAVSELHKSLIFDSAKDAKSKIESAIKEISDTNATPVTFEFFGGTWLKPIVDELLVKYPCPFNWIYPLNQTQKPTLAGAHITAVAGIIPSFKRSPSGTRVVEYVTECGSYCRTFGVLTPNSTNEGYQHTLDNLNELEDSLWLFGYKYNDIARTWFYNEDILSWYDPFNKARTEFYSSRKIFDGLLPASTGIGAPNPSGKKITSGAIAIKSPSKKIKVYEIESPLQCGAPEYGSSFSRAVEIDTPTSKRIMVSGTASIEPEGKTTFVDDIEKQVALTMKVISAILEARGLSLKDTVRSVIYCLRPEYYNSFKKWLQDNNIDFPHCPSFSIVCRSDLLFEVELEAAINIQPKK